MTARRGVSLVELLIAITVVTFIAASMTSLMTSNTRATSRDDAAREARRVSRSALNLLESELRSVETHGIIAPTNDSTLTIRSPYAFGVICATSGGTTLAMLPSGELPSNLVVEGKAGWAWRNAAGVYEWETTTSLGTGASGTCVSNGITPLTSDGGRVVTTAAPGGSPAIGSFAFLYREVTYALRASTAFPGRRALIRTPLNGTAQEIAGPFATTAEFRWYHMDNPVIQDTLPTDLSDLAGVQFVLPGESRNIVKMTGQVARTPFSTSIFFQNRPN